ncbi:MAG: leucine-rich repeat domain-containing protein, partial [Saprospiraceae bacterium]
MNNQLSGTIPNFNKIPDLRTLFLFNNQLTGTIPNFEKLAELRALNINNNQLTGNIPNFDKMFELRDLDLNSNELTGNIPNFDKLPELKNLYLWNNQLTGTIPNFDKLPKLSSLSLSNNLLMGTVPNFSKLPELESLYLFGNQLTGTIPNFDLIPNLVILSLYNNLLVGTIPNFDKLIQLQSLALVGNNLTGKIPNFNKLPKLRFLYLYNNQLSGNIPNFDSCKSLRKLVIYENNFNFTNLKNFTRKIDSFIYQPQHKFYKDTSFTLQKNQDLSINLQIDSSLSDNSYKWTNNINTSWTMDPSQDIHSNTYTFKNLQTKDAGRYTVKVTNPSLPLLTLESNTISIKVCNVQQDSSELVNLYSGTSGANWTNKTNWLQPGKPISTWHGISTTAEGCVRSINLDNNNLIGSIPALDLNTLDTLILSNNTLSGNIPELKIPFIKYINMRNNVLVGAFPAVLNDWMNLGGLDLGQNNLKGPVPPDMGDICELQELKLDNNKIEGELPEELTKLQKLQIGRVDFNNNKIDSLKEKIIFFCPFGDNILDKNPSYNRFLGICNRRCSGTEWNMLKDFPWIADTIGALRCKSDSNCVYTRSEAGFVNVRGIKVVYTQNICCADDQCNDRTVETRFYDCGGKRLETAQCGKNGFCTSFGAISMEEFDRLVYDKKWQCGDTLSIITDIKNIIPKKYIFNNTSQQANCYPNPVNEILTCEIEGKLKQLKVSDLQGKECKIKSIKQNGDLLEIDFSGLPSGIYFMEMWTDSG